jgi:predicted kinase
MQLFEFFQQDLDEGIHDKGIFKAVFMAGPPGAGKNLIIRQLGLLSYGLRLQDTDRTIAYLNASRTDNKIPYNNAGYQRGLDTTLRRQSMFQKEMLGLIINTTGRDPTATQKLNNQLKKAGYDTFMVFVDVEEQVASQRITQREKFATDPADRRPVEQEYFKSAYQDSKDNLEFYALMFGDQFAVLDNSADYGEMDKRGNVVNPDSRQKLDLLTRVAAKKVARFMGKPLSATAQEILDAAKAARLGPTSS